MSRAKYLDFKKVGVILPPKEILPMQDVRIPVHVDRETYEKLKAGAKRAGMSMSTWLRTLGLRELASSDPLILQSDAKYIKVPIPQAHRPRTKPGRPTKTGKTARRDGR